VISQGVTALLVMEHFLFDRSKVRFHWKNLLILPKEILSIFAIGSSGFLMQSAAAAMNGLLNNQIRTFGELANQGLNPEQLAQGSYVAAGLSAMGIIYPVGMMILMPIFGLNQGAQPILGYNFGAKKPERVRQTVLLSIVFSTGILVLGFLAFQWFAPQIIELFVQGEQEISPLLAEIGPAGLKTFYLMMPLLGVQIIGAGYFIALGKAVKSLTLTLSRQAFLIIALLIVPEVLGYMGIFWSAPIADGLAVIVTAIFFLSEIYKLGKNPSPQDHQPTAAEETQGREGYID
jgi:Na+-driven multidrug efflux pump